MITFLIRTGINALALLFIAQMSGGAIRVSNFVTALIAAIVIGLLNAVIKPLVLLITGGATCLLSCLTLGLWTLILSLLVNGLMFFLASALLKPYGFVVTGFVAPIAGAFALSLVNWVLSIIIPDKRDEQ